MSDYTQGPLNPEPAGDREESKLVKEIWEWLEAIVYAVILALLIHILVVQPTRVSGESMEPTLHNKDFLLVTRWAHVVDSMPSYGDIVIVDSRVNRPRTWVDDVKEPFMNYVAFFDKSAQGNYAWVKRVIGLPGDSLEFKDGYVYRNGEKLEESYTNEPGHMKYARSTPVVVPEGYVMVMGDNRNHSSDGRFIGPVPLDHVLGHVAVDLSSFKSF